MKIRVVGAELVHADGRTAWRDKADSFFFRSFALAPKSQPSDAVKGRNACVLRE
jgi:hypothetical protein